MMRSYARCSAASTQTHFPLFLQRSGGLVAREHSTLFFFLLFSFHSEKNIMHRMTDKMKTIISSIWPVFVCAVHGRNDSVTTRRPRRLVVYKYSVAPIQRHNIQNATSNRHC